MKLSKDSLRLTRILLFVESEELLLLRLNRLARRLGDSSEGRQIFRSDSKTGIAESVDEFMRAQASIL